MKSTLPLTELYLGLTNKMWNGLQTPSYHAPNTETRGGRLTPVAQMETTLAYLSDPGYQTSVGEIRDTNE